MKEEYQCQYCGEYFGEDKGFKDTHEKYCSANPGFQKLMNKQNPSLKIPKKSYLMELLKC